MVKIHQFKAQTLKLLEKIGNMDYLNRILFDQKLRLATDKYELIKFNNICNIKWNKEVNKKPTEEERIFSAIHLAEH